MQDPQTVYVVNETNSWGIAGFVLSLLGWFTCGLLCIPGFFLSLVGLRHPDKGLAITGLILGLPGVFFFFLFGIGIIGFMMTAIVGVAAVADADLGKQPRETQQVDRLTAEASERIEKNSQRVRDELAKIERDAAERKIPNPLVVQHREFVPLEQLYPQQPAVEPEPAAEIVKAEEKPAEPKLTRRTFTDSTGKQKINVFVIAYKDGWVKFRKVDEETEQTLPVTRLSERDRKWLEENYVDRSKPATLD
jgi:hypothetical protein